MEEATSRPHPVEPILSRSESPASPRARAMWPPAHHRRRQSLDDHVPRLASPHHPLSISPASTSTSNLLSAKSSQFSRRCCGPRGAGRRKTIALLGAFTLLFSSITFTLYNDSLARGERRQMLGAGGAGALDRLRRSWIAQAIWLSVEENDDDEERSSRLVNASEARVDPPQRHVLEEQLFTTDTQEERKRRIDDICDRYDLRGSPLELDRDDLRQIIVDDANKMLYCYIPKVKLVEPLEIFLA